MGKTKFGWKSLGVYFRAFLIVAAAFLIVGMGTLGSVRSAGDAYELKAKGSGSLEPAVMFRLSQLEVQDGEDATKTTTVRLAVKQVYLNVAAIYSKPGVAATLRLGRASSSSGTFTTRVEGSIANFYQALSDTEDVTAATEDAFYNWVTPFEVPEEGWKVDSYSYYKLTSTTCNILLNEVVFVGEKLDSNGDPTGELAVVPAEIFSGKDAESGLTAGGDRLEDAAKKAALLLDAQQIPTLSQTSFFRFGPEEVATLMSIRAMRDGGDYDKENIGYYYGDKSYNSFGLDLVALGTAIFGMSPFGLRFFPMLASFGVLVAGYFLVKRLFKSEKAGFAFSLVYALSGISIALGHLGTPLTIGVFFLVMSALFCHRFYAEGMAKARVLSALPLALSGLFAAAAISVNGAYVLPVAGIVALFVCGMIRQQTAKRYHLAKAAEEQPAPPAEQSAEEPAPAPEPAEKRVARVQAEYRYKNTVAPLLFGLCLLLGAVVIALIAALPAASAYVRLYDDPSAPVQGVFGIAWKAFAAGFTGGTVTAAHSDSLLFYETFRGTGDMYAVTAAVINPVALVAAIAGIVYAFYRIIRLCLAKEWGKEERTQLRAVAVPFVGLILSLFTALFAEGRMAFVLLALVFAFALFGGAARRYTEAEGKLGKGYRIAAIVCIVLLAAMFLLFAVVTFSVPLPATVMYGILG